MFKETVFYKDFNGVEKSRDLYFNLTQAELYDMEFGKAGRLTDRLNAIIDTSDQEELIKFFREILVMSYGEKSDDGEFFIKNDEVRNRFQSTQYFSDLYIRLATDTDYAVKFINNLVDTTDVDFNAADQKANHEKIQEFIEEKKLGKNNLVDPSKNPN